MVRAIITWSLHNRLIVLLGVVALIGAGIHSAQNLNVEAYPDPTPPLVEVITQNPGASPEEMERLIGIPIETALNGMPGLEYLRSTSISGLNDIKCQFKYGTDYWQARQELINRLAAIGNLPPGVTPGLSPWSPIGEIVRYVLEGPGYTTKQLKAVQDWVLEPRLQASARCDRCDRLRWDRQAISDSGRHPADETVRRDDGAGRRRDQEIQRQRRG